MSHDQLFKDLLRAFFRDFLVLFLPRIAEGIDPDSITFLDPQTFTDVPEGQLRLADLVARVRARGGIPELVQIHTEVQSQPDADLGYRVWEYNALLRLRNRQPIVSVVLLPFTRTGAVRRVRYTETLFGEEYIGLEYWQIGLRDLAAEEYVVADSLLGTALAALMRPGPEGRADLKIAIIRRLRDSDVDEARTLLLVNLVETYLTLDEAEEAVLRARLQEEGVDDVEATELTWADRLLQRGREQGIAQEREMLRTRLREQGVDDDDVEATELTWADRLLQRGREQGALNVKREVVVRQASARFGAVPADLDERLAGADDATLDQLLARVVQAASLDELMGDLSE